MQEIWNPDRWVEFTADAVFNLPSKKPRTVVFHTNCEEDTPLYIERGFGTEATRRFLCVARKGLDKVRFIAEGPCRISPAVGMVVYIYTADGSDVHRISYDEETFTTLHVAAPRNPQLEFLEYQRERNMRANLLKIEEELERKYSARQGRSADDRGVDSRRAGSDRKKPDAGQQAHGDRAPEAPDGSGSGNDGGGAGAGA